MTISAFGSSIIYGLGSNGDLYTGTVTGSSFSFSSGVEIKGTDGVISDIAEANGAVYATTFDRVYSVDPSTGVATALANTYGSGFSNMVALTFGPNGTLYGAEAGNNSDYYTIATSGPNAGKATAVATNATIDSAGDLEVIGNTMYVTTGGLFGDSSLEEINLTNGHVTDLGVIETSGGEKFSEVFGLAIANGVLYGFTADNPEDIINFGSTSGTISNIVTVVSNSNNGGYGTCDLVFYGATDNEDPPTAPEPATLAIMGLGLLSLGGIAFRRREPQA